MSTKNLKQLVKEVDPDYAKVETVYEFSNNRKFKGKKDPYSN